MIDYSRINNTLGKLKKYLEQHGNVCVSVSGGSDSTIITHIISTYFREYLPKIKFIFCDTGIEFEATKRHIDSLQKRYDIDITTLQGEPVPLVIAKWGVPVLSKRFSQVVNGYCNGAAYAIDKIDYQQFDKEFTIPMCNMAKAIKERGVLVSDKCCDKSKKRPADKYCKDNHISLVITGERKSEGGVRAMAYNDCYHTYARKAWAKYMPLYFWNDETKQYYKNSEHIEFSDCYEAWGMKRTGCAGCPFGSSVWRDLKIIKQYEPKMYTAAIKLFGVSYALMDEFMQRDNKILRGVTNG